MKKKKHKRPFLPAGCGGGFAGFLLWAAIKGISGQKLSGWMAILLFVICVTLGVFLQIIDDRKVKEDIVKKKDKGKFHAIRK